MLWVISDIKAIYQISDYTYLLIVNQVTNCTNVAITLIIHKFQKDQLGH